MGFGSSLTQPCGPETRPAPLPAPLVLCSASFSKLGTGAVDLGPQSILVRLGCPLSFPPCGLHRVQVIA
jgi:hypothetical protein